MPQLLFKVQGNYICIEVKVKKWSSDNELSRVIVVQIPEEKVLQSCNHATFLIADLPIQSRSILDQL